jgi:hypothetical protein
MGDSDLASFFEEGTVGCQPLRHEVKRRIEISVDIDQHVLCLLRLIAQKKN